MTDKKNGSITIFMSLLLMIIASLFFTLLEGSRFLMLEMMAALHSQSVTESMFAEYNVPAYENYHLFLMDSSYGSEELQLSELFGKMQVLGQENLNPTATGPGRYCNYLQMDTADSSVERYEIATDQNASALLKQMVQIAKKEFAADILDQVVQDALGIDQSSEQGKEADDHFNGALDTLDQAKEGMEEGKNGKKMGLRTIQIENRAGDTEMQQSGADQEVNNPMEDVKNAKNSPLLAQILADGKEISAKQLEKEDSIRQRTLYTGNYGKNYEISAVDKAAVIQYLKKYLVNYQRADQRPHALAYEQEYLLFGKYTDEDNLKKMAGRLLLVREGINFAYLLSDSVKREEALAMATTISAAVGIPMAATAVQMGILASWAYAESIAELRTLFLGGKVALVKTSGSWTVGLSEIAAVLADTSFRSKEVSGGQGYEEYLYAFLLLERTDTIGIRSADILEKNLRLYDGYSYVKLDCMITAMEAVHTYHAEQVFLNFVTIGQFAKKGYRYEKTSEFSYLGKEEG